MKSLLFRSRHKKVWLGAMLLCCCAGPLSAQTKADSIPEEIKAKILNNAKHFTFDLYIDAYYNYTFGGSADTSNIVPFSANCPVHDQIRLNVAALQVVYNSDRVRGKLQLQYGDAPNLLTAADAQWVKNIRQANFGFRAAKGLWIDAGYIFTPVGMESSWPVWNWISTVTLCGYFEPGAVLGAKITYKPSRKVDFGCIFGNTYSLAYSKNTHMGGILFVDYYPTPKLQITFANLFGNQALVNATIKNNILYNDIQVYYTPSTHFNVMGQFDFAWQTNSTLPPDSSEIAGMTSGFVQGQYWVNKHFSLSARFQYYTDPNGFLSGAYTYEGKTTGLKNLGGSFQVEYKPVDFGYIRLEYLYLHANPGNNVYYSNTSDNMQGVVLTTGVFF